MIPLNFPIVPILQSFINEGQQFFYEKSDIDKNKIKLEEQISYLKEQLNKIEEYQNITKDFYNHEERQHIIKCKDFLDDCDKLLKTLPSNLNIITGYFYRKGNNYKELLDRLKILDEKKVLIDEILKQSASIFNTVIIHNPPRYDLYIQQTYTINIKLRLKAPPKIKAIFDKYPNNLKSEYLFEIQMEESSNKDVYLFKRDEFIKLHFIEKEFKICSMSRQNHCVLQMRNTFKSNKKIHLDSNEVTTTPEELLAVNQQKDNYSTKFQLFLIVNGQNGMTIIQNQIKNIHYRSGQECELKENDQIVFFQDSNQNPQVSFIVQQIMIQQAEFQPNPRYQLR